MDLDIISRQLDDIEAEMSRLGILWDFNRSVPKITSAFGYGQMSFEEWLSGVFLPNARAAIKSGVLPSDSQVGVAAVRNFDGDDRMNNLVSLLSEFDQKVRGYARTHRSPSSKATGGIWSRLRRKLTGLRS